MKKDNKHRNFNYRVESLVIIHTRKPIVKRKKIKFEEEGD